MEQDWPEKFERWLIPEPLNFRLTAVCMGVFLVGWLLMLLTGPSAFTGALVLGSFVLLIPLSFTGVYWIGEENRRARIRLLEDPFFHLAQELISPKNGFGYYGARVNDVLNVPADQPIHVFIWQGGPWEITICPQKSWTYPKNPPWAIRHKKFYNRNTAIKAMYYALKGIDKALAESDPSQKQARQLRRAVMERNHE